MQLKVYYSVIFLILRFHCVIQFFSDFDALLYSSLVNEAFCSELVSAYGLMFFILVE